MSKRYVELLRKGAGVWNAWREANPDERPDLLHADLSDLNLEGVNFARLDLRDVRFLNTNLQNADLRDTDLRQASLSDAHLGGTRFDGARMGDTTLLNVNLARSSGLDTVSHTSGSSIGINTVLSSAESLPENFFRRAGVHESRIQLARIRGRQPFYHSCFISYSHQDAASVREIGRQLFRAGVNVWIDSRGLTAGNKLTSEIKRAVEKQDKFILCCSNHSLLSGWVNAELRIAVQKEIRLGRLISREQRRAANVVVPIDLDRYLRMDQWRSRFRTRIQKRLAVDFFEAPVGSPKFQAGLMRLLSALLTEAGHRQQEKALPEITGQSAK